MANEILNSLLKEYEQKKLRAEMDVETRKTQLYKDIPRLERIEEELSNYSISTAKSILANNKSTNSLESLKDKINDLKKEKEKILKSIQKKNKRMKKYLLILMIISIIEMIIIVLK